MRTCSNTSWRASRAHSLTQATAPAPVNSVAAISLTGDVCSAVSTCAAALHCGNRCFCCCCCCCCCCCLRASLACRKRWRDGMLSWQWCCFKGEGLAPLPIFACVNMAVVRTESKAHAACCRPSGVRERTRRTESIVVGLVSDTLPTDRI